MKTKITIKDMAIMTVGITIVAAAVFFFLMPSHCSVSSVAGLAIVLANFMPFTVAQITMVINVALLFVGFIACGGDFGTKTVYTTIMMPLLMRLFEILFPDFQSLTGDPALDVACYIFVVSFGLAILFNMNASSGGLDVVAKIMNRYLRMDIGKAMGLSGMVIALSSAFAYDTKIVVLSILGTYLNGKILDDFIFDRSLKRRVCIMSPKEEEIKDFCINNLHSGASIYKVIGAYHMQQHYEIVVIVDRSEYQKLMAFVREVDPDAFVTVIKINALNYRPKELGERKF